jgi:hypothetical protein
VFFTDTQQLTDGSSASSEHPDLYRFYVESGQLIDLTPSAPEGESADVQGVVRISEDGSHVYFVAKGVFVHGATPRMLIY